MNTATTTKRCESCPAAADATCLAHATGHARFCEWASMGGIYRDHVRDNSRVGTPIAVRRETTPAALSLSHRPGVTRARHEAPSLPEGDYITKERLVRDTGRLLQILPPDVDLIAAIPRSGLIPGSLLAFDLHVPLVAVSRQNGVASPGHGFRLEHRSRATPKHVLLIDDTIATGREMRAALPMVRSAYPSAKITRAVVYADPRSLDSVDLWVHTSPGHYLEWNWPNSAHGKTCAYDFDGILCRDFTAAECADDATYRATMAKIEPLFLPRRAAVPLIVTARPESCRDITTTWLDKYQVKVHQLVMRDWEIDPARDWNTQVGEWKAGHYTQSRCVLFAESDPAQAQVIAARTGKAVLCPALGRAIPARPQPQSRESPAYVALTELRLACDYLGPPVPCGCGSLRTCFAGKGKDYGKGNGHTVADLDCFGCLSSPTWP